MRQWSWASVVSVPADWTVGKSTKLEGDLSTCPPLYTDGQVDRFAPTSRDDSHAVLDDSDERASIVEEGSGAPRPWAEALARLDPERPPADVPLRRWHRFIDDCGRFVDAGWAGRAADLGWSP